MDIDVVPPVELGPELLAEWARIQASDRDLASPFLSPGFTLACAGLRPDTRVAVLRTDDGSAGFFPFEARRAGFGRAVGHGISDIQGLVAPGTAQVDTRELLRGCGLRSWEFDHLLAAQGRWLSGTPHRWVEEVSPAIDLSDGWQAYSAALKASSGSLQSTTARRRRGLERDHGPVTLTFDERDHALLDRVIDWKSDQYRRTGRRDVFAVPGMRRLVHDLLDVRDPAFSAPLSVLRAGDHVVAAHLGLRSPSVLAWWFPVYPTEFSRYSPGLVLTLEILRSMGGEGLRVLDLGKGDEPYKQRLATTGIPLLAGSVSRHRPAAGMVAARRWPREQAKTLLAARPGIDGRVRGLRHRVTGLGAMATGRRRPPHTEAGH